MQPAPWLIEFQLSTAALMHQLSPVMDAFRQISEPIRRIQEDWQERMAPLQRLIQEWQRAEHERKRVEASGWLTHVTTPFELLEHVEDEALAAMLENHYRENWQEVKQVFLARLEEHAIDEEAKATFVDALESHGHGIYRATARMLLPEIERVIREECYKGAPPKKNATSQIEFREAAKRLPLDAIENWAFGLYDALDHLYEHCNTAEDALRFSSKPIPNRHAIMHGRVPYNCMCSSMNMLILADFVFQLVTAIKSYEVPLESTAVPA